MSLAERKWLRLATLVILYVAQGIPWGFMATTIPAYLASRGLDPGAVGVALATTTLPYTFKWVWGPVIDAISIPRFGRRRPWIIFAQFMMAATVAAMLALGDLTTDLKMLMWTILIHTVFNALQDVSVDALAVDLLQDDERGKANGMMYGAKYGGGAIGGIGLATVIAYTSLETALVVQAALLLAIMFIPLLVRETNAPPAPRAKIGHIVRSFAHVFASRSAAVAILVMLTCTFALGVVTVRAYTLFTQELGWSAQKYTSLVGGWGLVVGGSAAVSGGFMADKFGPRKVAMIAWIAMGFGWLVFSLSSARWNEDWFVYALSIWETASQAVMSVSLFAACMQLSLPTIGASQFAAYMALSNFGTTLGYRAAGPLAELSAVDTWRLAAAIQVVTVLLLFLVNPAQTRKEVGDTAGRAPMRGWIVLGAVATFLVGMTAYIVKPML